MNRGSKPSRNKRRKKPLEIKRGSVTVKVYPGKNRVNGSIYPQFTLIYYDGVVRKKRRFADLESATKEAGIVAESLAKGENHRLHLTAADASVYAEAIAKLRPFNIPLNVAVQEYTSALKSLPVGSTLKDAVDCFLKRNPASMQPRTVRQVVDEMLTAKRAAKLSTVYLWDLEVRLNRFCGAFSMNISGVSGKLLQAWLDDMKGSGRTKQNYLRVVTALIRFAIRRKYLLKDAIEEVEAVQQAKEDNGETEIFTPAEMTEILTAAREEMIPWLAIAGFAGLRTAEIQRLDWSEVNLTERHIEITAEKAKTASRRLAPITDNLAAWLKPYAKPAGPVAGFERWWNEIPKVAEAVNAKREMAALLKGKDHTKVHKFVWKHNALRHSFCSYRLAVVKNPAQVAMEAGNSPQIIHKHYHKLVSEVEAAKWFAVNPAGDVKATVAELTPPAKK
jgi:integrase